MPNNKYLQQLIEATQKYTTELYPSVALAQAILESGVLTSKGPSTLATKYNNWYGIKSSKSWQGKTTPALNTLEDDGSGTKHTIQQDY